MVNKKIVITITIGIFLSVLFYYAISPKSYPEGWCKDVTPLNPENPIYGIRDNTVFLMTPNMMYNTPDGKVCMEINDADAKTFEQLEKEYGKDINNVYYLAGTLRKITGADPESFEVLEENYVKDKNYVYFNYEEIITGADPESFEVLDFFYSKDKTNYFYSHQKIRDEVKIKEIQEKFNL